MPARRGQAARGLRSTCPTYAARTREPGTSHCQSATLFGNYGGAAGNLRSPSGGVSYGQAVGWRYTTGNGYAASVDGPFNTPRFILRSCISRTPPGGGIPPRSRSATATW